jgi:TrmH family RNA methyltransferase
LSLDRVHIVLVGNRDPLNLGSAARAMKNCDLSRLTLVAPVRRVDEISRRTAVHAEDILDGLQVVDALPEAVRDCVFVVGTTSRTIPGRTPLTPREVGRKLAEDCQRGEVALVFGGEESGLSNDDLVRCHAVSTIPSGRAQPSFNLAQSVMLYGYEVFQAFREAHPTAAVQQSRAPDAMLQALETSLRELMVEAGFPEPDRKRHGVLELILALRRAELTQAEAKLWRAAIEGVRGALRRAPKS